MKNELLYIFHVLLEETIMLKLLHFIYNEQKQKYNIL